MQNWRDVNKHAFFCFVDYEKVFDRVKHKKLIDIPTEENRSGR